ncbi:MAG: hypothetical protein ACQGQP_08185 [Desulfovibrio sp.]|jgi:hypothetical protein|nr:hypothetical protein [Mailhella sp.]
MDANTVENEKLEAWKKASSAPEAGNSLGIDLGEIGLPFAMTEGMSARFEKGVLLITHGPFVTSVRAVPPSGTSAEGEQDNPAVAGVQVLTLLPREMAGVFEKDPHMMNAFNGLAVGGALAQNEKGSFYVGSRATLFSRQGAWHEVLVPLLRHAVLYGPSGMFSGAMAMMQNEGKPLDPEAAAEGSAWTPEDLDKTAALIPDICPHSRSGMVLSAEFPMGGGASALLVMDASVRHPGIGAGLLSTLSLPLAEASQEERERVTLALNRLEMYRESRAQHYGAWCWQENDTLRYVSFFPNIMHPNAAVTTSWPSVQAARAPWALHIAASMLHEARSK